MAKLSIIVPVYNSEKYLEECLESIAAQPFDDWECVLIDDGSIDRSGEICEEWSRKDGRFRVFHQTNSGLPTARNNGFAHSTGEWIHFVDSDDVLAKETYAALFDALEAEELIAFCGTRDQNSLMKKREKEKKTLTGAEIFDLLLIPEVSGYAWTKLIKREVVEKLKFKPDIKMWEDFIFTYELYETVHSAAFLPEPLYYYRQNPAGMLGTKEAHLKDFATVVPWLKRIKKREKTRKNEKKREIYRLISSHYAQARRAALLGKIPVWLRLKIKAINKKLRRS